MLPPQPESAFRGRGRNHNEIRVTRLELRIFSGSANPSLAEEICSVLGCPLGEARLTRFSDGEIHFQILENVRGADVFIIQPTSHPANETLVELLIMIDAFKRASAGRITAVLPYYGYARQDRKDKPRVPISSKLVADLIEAAGAHRVLTVDLHAGQIQGFFNIPVDHLFAAPVILDYVGNLDVDFTVVSPDAGGVERARAFAKRLKTNLAIIDKRRKEANVAEVLNIIGEVDNRNILIVDDMVDTCGTLIKSIEALKKAGAARVYATATHAVLSGPAIRLIQENDLEELIVTNTIRQDGHKGISKIRVLSVAPLLGEAIRSIHEETSVSKLFI
ncbi:MAG: ribose-phosphate pyrophosphokinase [Acidobacteria bacterium]|nr:ribose-phosphate pyrophosphokinase [Acidobacteriota bacterium]